MKVKVRAKLSAVPGFADKWYILIHWPLYSIDGIKGPPIYTDEKKARRAARRFIKRVEKDRLELV